MEWNFELVVGPLGGVKVTEKPVWGGSPVILGITEGPAWDGKALLFSHIPTSRIMRYDPKTGECTEFRTETNHTNGLAFDSLGRLYGCRAADHCIARYEPDGTVTKLPNKLDGHRTNRCNDLAIDTKGRIWFTDPFGSGPVEERELDHASVLRLDPQPDGNWILKQMTFDMTSPNGILFSRDERTLYVAESGYRFVKEGYRGVRELRAYPLQNDDSLGKYQVLHTFGQDTQTVHRGIDGMCLTTDGNIVATAGWRAAGPGPMIYVFAPNGRVLETHPVPVDMPSNCTFGDADLCTLYVTTSGGHLYRVRNTGHRGWLIYPR